MSHIGTLAARHSQPGRAHIEVAAGEHEEEARPGPVGQPAAGHLGQRQAHGGAWSAQQPAPEAVRHDRAAQVARLDMIGRLVQAFGDALLPQVTELHQSIAQPSVQGYLRHRLGDGLRLADADAAEGCAHASSSPNEGRVSQSISAALPLDGPVSSPWRAAASWTLTTRRSVTGTSTKMMRPITRSRIAALRAVPRSGASPVATRRSASLRRATPLGVTRIRTSSM